MLRMLIGRCHVADSYSDVIRYVISRMKKGHATYRDQSRTERHSLLRAIIKIHKENRVEYASVMGGGWWGYVG